MNFNTVDIITNWIPQDPLLWNAIYALHDYQADAEKNIRTAINFLNIKIGFLQSGEKSYLQEQKVIYHIGDTLRKWFGDDDIMTAACVLIITSHISKVQDVELKLARDLLQNKLRELRN